MFSNLDPKALWRIRQSFEQSHCNLVVSYRCLRTFAHGVNIVRQQGTLVFVCEYGMPSIHIVHTFFQAYIRPSTRGSAVDAHPL